MIIIEEMTPPPSPPRSGGVQHTISWYIHPVWHPPLRPASPAVVLCDKSSLSIFAGNGNHAFYPLTDLLSTFTPFIVNILHSNPQSHSQIAHKPYNVSDDWNFI